MFALCFFFLVAAALFGVSGLCGRADSACRNWLFYFFPDMWRYAGCLIRAVSLRLVFGGEGIDFFFFFSLRVHGNDVTMVNCIIILLSFHFKRIIHDELDKGLFYNYTNYNSKHSSERNCHFTIMILSVNQKSHNDISQEISNPHRSYSRHAKYLHLDCSLPNYSLIV